MSRSIALAGELRSALAAVGDPERAAAMQRYMKSAMPFYGVGAPALRTVCRRVFARHPLAGPAEWRTAVLWLWDGATHREERYAAIELTGHRRYRDLQRPETLPLYRHLVVTGAWWDYVDVIASNRVGPILRAYPASVAPLIRAWAADPDLWVRRTAVLSQLQGKAGTDVELLRFVLEQNLDDSLHGRQFFIRKAVGWALRQHARVDPDWGRAFVAEHEERLSGLSRREALKHLR